jgi:hypothetical protein
MLGSNGRPPANTAISNPEASGLSSVHSLSLSLISHISQSTATGLLRPYYSLLLASCMTFEHYIFGYGSLLCAHSRAITAPALIERAATPVKVRNLQRLWSCRVPHAAGWTAMGVRLQPSASCVGVLLPVTHEELQQFDVRELGYERQLIRHSDIERMGEHDQEHEHSFWKVQQHSPKKVWVYIQEEQCSTSLEHPIPQTYVDVILRGCLSISDEFVKEFLVHTHGWESEQDDDVYWVNDRHDPLYVRADIDYSTKQGPELDHLLSLHRPLEMAKRKHFQRK